MNRHILSLSPEQLTTFDLDAFIAHAERLNQQNRETFTNLYHPFFQSAEALALALSSSATAHCIHF